MATMKESQPYNDKSKLQPQSTAMNDTPTPPNGGINFPQTELEVLNYWREINAFQTQLSLTSSGPVFTFYDGPPFATGLPHYGHLLASTIKDVIPRYWAMKGYHVERRWGWDTHGVPIEHEIDTMLNIRGRDAVMKMGIEAYNARCREIVMRYTSEWKGTIERLGRWVDFEGGYKTMDTPFMESCWWVFKQLFDKGHVYRAYSIMPYSTALCTPLSQSEAKEAERLTTDPAVLVAFPLLGGGVTKENTSLVIYTTTPWTLPSNLFIAVHPEFEYLEVEDRKTGKRYILLESGLEMLYKEAKLKANGKKAAEYTVVGKVQGKEMIGWKYIPLYDYFTSTFSDCFQVIDGSAFVEAGEGTGIVHMAPAFGQEDYDAAVAAGFISPDRLPPCPVDEMGRFTAEVKGFGGLHVKDAGDAAITQNLKFRGDDRLLMVDKITHTDKFCWRSKTQLIRRAVSSWFIRVKDSIPNMLENMDSSTHWVPGYVGEKRFKSWVSTAHDWNVSRNRYWGTPIPLWVSDDYEEVVCVGSIEELVQLSGYTGPPLVDMHRDKVDGITIPSKKGKGVLRRVDEIFDCWFESGSMPYASRHYPFEHSGPDDLLGKHFPADFIAEGLDQTRGWFYSLTVLGTKLFGQSPFRNVVVNGMVLDASGRKMSKSDKVRNYSKPNDILNQFGSDALRLFLINSPAVRGEPLKFNEKDIGPRIVSRTLIPLWNSYRFFSEQVPLHEKTTGRLFVADSSFTDKPPKNTMDRWILSDTQSLLRFIEQEMQAYRLDTIVPRLIQGIDNLTNLYIRFNRKRLKGITDSGENDTTGALNTLFHVLFTLVRAMAPFTPFITDHIYELLKPFLAKETLSQFVDCRSVHFLPFPTAQNSLSNPIIERQVSSMQNIIQLGRLAREKASFSLKQPLSEIVVIITTASDAESTTLPSDLALLKEYIIDELNVRKLTFVTDEQQEQYGVKLLFPRMNWSALGKKVKDKEVLSRVKTGVSMLCQRDLRDYLRGEELVVHGVRLEEGDLVITRGHDTAIKKVDGSLPLNDKAHWEAAYSDEVTVLVNISPGQELVDEGLAREVLSKVQRMRKNAGLVSSDEIRVFYDVLLNPSTTEGLGHTSPIPSEKRSSVAYIQRLKNVDGVFASHVELFEGAGVLGGVLEQIEMDGEEWKAEMDEYKEKGVVVLEEEHEVGRYDDKLVLRLRLVKV